MKKLKKITGYFIVIFFVGLVISFFIYNILTAGWFFILTLLTCVALLGLFILGIHLLSDSNEDDA